MNIPDPLHPAIVHFPIVLILLGAVGAIAALIMPRSELLKLAALLLSLGAAGAIAAAWSGDEDEDLAEKAGTRAEQVLDEHEEWGERARNAAIIAALSAVIAAVSLKRAPRISRSVAALTAVVAIAASWCVAEAGHYGGRLVYEHGVGVRQGNAKTTGDK
jgi:uncharacterized membrane protein